MIDGVKLNTREGKLVMEKLLDLKEKVKEKAAEKNTQLLPVAEVCPACAEKVGLCRDPLIKPGFHPGAAEVSR